jgi:hypothetical protein
MGTRKKWTEEENAYLIENYGNTPLSDIAIFLGRPITTIQAHLQTMGIRKRRFVKEVLDVCPNGDVLANCKKHGISEHKMYRGHKHCIKCRNEYYLTHTKKYKYNKIDIDILREELNKYGYTLLSTKYGGASIPVDVVCDKGHSVKIRWNDFKKSIYKCRICSYDDNRNGLRYTIEQARDILSLRGYSLVSEIYISNNNKLECVCPNGHPISIRLNGFLNGVGCGQCFRAGASKAEKEVLSFIRGTVPSNIEILENKKGTLGNKEIDIFIPAKNLAIEYNGLYWHQVELKGKEDFEKYLLCKEKGIRYISIYEDEWIYKRVFVEHYLRNMLGIHQPKYVLRPKDITIEEVSFVDTKVLLDSFHYNGSRSASYYFGILYNNVVIGCVLLAKPTRQTSHYDIELVRMCLNPEFRIHGIWSYISKNVLKKYFAGKTIVSFSDNRRDTGGVYGHMGFVFDGTIGPDYYWCMKDRRFHKSGLRKTKEEKLSGLTETELREEQGYYKVYDVGKTRWVKFV